MITKKSGKCWHHCQMIAGKILDQELQERSRGEGMQVKVPQPQSCEQKICIKVDPSSSKAFPIYFEIPSLGSDSTPRVIDSH